MTTTPREFKTTAARVPISALICGHEVPQDLNMRRTAPAEGVDDMVQMIGEKGQLIPLICLRAPKPAGKLIVDDGNRRTLAMRKLVETGRWDKASADADVIIVEGDINDPAVLQHAQEIAMMANIGRLPPHEIDQYEQFVHIRDSMVRNQATPEAAEAAIASKFAMELPRVRRVLALGVLHPKVRAAWRAGTLGHDGPNIVRAFTLLSQDKQEAAFDRLTKQKKATFFWAQEIKQAAGADQDTGKLLRFVGMENYKAAGGTIVADLFGSSDVVSDKVLLAEMVKTKMARLSTHLVDVDGWAWASPREGLGNESYSWSRLSPNKAKPTKEEAARLKELQKIVDAADEDENEDDAVMTAAAEEAQAEIETIETAQELRGYTPEVRSRSGVILTIANSGNLDMQLGVVKPAAARAAARAAASSGGGAKKKKGAPAGGGAISNALMANLAVQATSAAQRALIADPTGGKSHVGLVVLLASLFHGGHVHTGLNDKGAAAEASPGGMGWQVIRGKQENVSALIERIKGRGILDLMKLAQRAAAMCVNFQIGYRKIGAMQIDGAQEIAALIDGPLWNTEIETAFQRKDFFERAPAAIARTALEECGAPVPKGGGKAALVKAAVDITKDKGWLPSVLRTIHYKGPVATPKKAGAKAAKKPAKKTAAKKHK